MYVTSEGNSLKRKYQFEAKKQIGKLFFDSAIEVYIKLFFSNLYIRDWDNYHKLSMDSLNGIVWKDDSLIQKATVEKCFDKENPRIEIDIIPIQDVQFIVFYLIRKLVTCAVCGHTWLCKFKPRRCVKVKCRSMRWENKGKKS